MAPGLPGAKPAQSWLLFCNDFHAYLIQLGLSRLRGLFSMRTKESPSSYLLPKAATSHLPPVNPSSQGTTKMTRKRPRNGHDNKHIGCSHRSLMRVSKYEVGLSMTK